MTSQRSDYYTTAIRKEATFELAYVEEDTGDDDDELGDNEPPMGIRLHGGPQLNAQGFTGRGIKVGVIDNGIDRNHPLFDGKVTGGYIYRDGSQNHGTHVAGTIHMMAPEAELRDYCVIGHRTQAEYTVSEAIAQAILDAYEDGCDVINMSIGGPNINASILEQVRYVQSKGVVLVAAACNGGDGDPMTHERGYPACHEETISIAAVQKEHNLPVVRSSNSNPGVDYAGIGQDVKSFRNGSDGYRTDTGTSMACPHICGLIAALMSGPNASEFPRGEGRDAKIRELLKQYTMDIGLPGFDNSTGLGFVTFLSRPEFDSMFSGQTAVQSEQVNRKHSKNGVYLPHDVENKVWV